MTEWKVTVDVEADRASFISFVEEVARPLRQALIAAYGAQKGAEVTADALAYAWEHWDRLAGMDNPAGYVYRVGQSAARRGVFRRSPVLSPPPPPGEGDWFEPDDVIFSDIWTSYRLTAYLPQYVAAQHKPGTGVADQDERRLIEVEFFDPRTTQSRRIEILDRFKARGVIVNRNPTYGLPTYRLAADHPEMITILKEDPKYFELLFDEGDWAIFRRKPAR